MNQHSKQCVFLVVLLCGYCIHYVTQCSSLTDGEYSSRQETHRQAKPLARPRGPLPRALDRASRQQTYNHHSEDECMTVLFETSARFKRRHNIAAGTSALESGARKEFVVDAFIEPGTFDVEEFEAGHKSRQCECIYRKLRDGLICACVRLVVENVHRSISHLKKVDVARDVSRFVWAVRTQGIGRHLGDDDNSVLALERCDFGFVEPDRDFDGDRCRIVGEHEALQFGMPLKVGADSGQDQSGGLSCGVLSFDDDKFVESEKVGPEL